MATAPHQCPIDPKHPFISEGYKCAHCENEKRAELGRMLSARSGASIYRVPAPAWVNPIKYTPK